MYYTVKWGFPLENTLSWLKVQYGVNFHSALGRSRRYLYAESHRRWGNTRPVEMDQGTPVPSLVQNGMEIPVDFDSLGCAQPRLAPTVGKERSERERGKQQRRETSSFLLLLFWSRREVWFSDSGSRRFFCRLRCPVSQNLHKPSGGVPSVCDATRQAALPLRCSLPPPIHPFWNPNSTTDIFLAVPHLEHLEPPSRTFPAANRLPKSQTHKHSSISPQSSCLPCG